MYFEFFAEFAFGYSLVAECIFGYDADMKLKDEKKLEAVVSATCRLAAERGLLGMTLSEIAKAAGIGTSTLYVYFDDKEALFNEVYRHAKREAMAFYSGEVDPAAPVKVRVRGVWNRMLDHRLRRHDEVSFMEQFMGSVYMSEESRAYTAQVTEDLLQVATEGQSHEILKPVPVPFLVSCFLGSVRETGRMIQEETIADNEENRAIAFQLCWDGLRS